MKPISTEKSNGITRGGEEEKPGARVRGRKRKTLWKSSIQGKSAAAVININSSERPVMKLLSSKWSPKTKRWGHRLSRSGLYMYPHLLCVFSRCTATSLHYLGRRETPTFSWFLIGSAITNTITARGKKRKKSEPNKKAFFKQITVFFFQAKNTWQAHVQVNILRRHACMHTPRTA